MKDKITPDDLLLNKKKAILGIPKCNYLFRIYEKRALSLQRSFL